jgi:tetratricopeptide (TPR) repeat protein
MAGVAGGAGYGALAALTEFDRTLVSFGEHYTAVARSFGPLLAGAGQADQGRAQLRAVATLGIERENLLKAFDWALVSEDAAALHALFPCLAGLFGITSEFPLLRYCARCVRAWARDNQDLRLEFAANLAMAQLRWRHGQYAAALEVLTTAEGLLAGLEGSMAVGRCRLLRASLDHAQARPQAARAVALEALAECRRSQDRQGEVQTLNLLGQLEVDAGEYTLAQELLAEALSLARASGDCQGEAAALDSLGAAIAGEGRLDEAADLDRSALAIYSSLAARQGAAAGLCSLGEVDLALGNLPQAQEALARALNLAREIGDRSGQAKALNALGRLSLRVGNLEAALRQLEEAHATSAAIGDWQGLRLACASLASALLRLGQLPAAMHYAAEELRLARQPGRERLLVEACLRGAAVLLAAGSAREAALTLHASRLWAVAYPLDEEAAGLGRRIEDELAQTVKAGALSAPDHAQLCRAAAALSLGELANTLQGLLHSLGSKAPLAANAPD